MGRLCKAKRFSRDARKAAIGDDELSRAFQEVLVGQAVDLGGGVFKKRVGSNAYRAILLIRSRDLWVYQMLFAKNDRDISKMTSWPT